MTSQQKRKLLSSSIFFSDHWKTSKRINRNSVSSSDVNLPSIMSLIHSSLIIDTSIDVSIDVSVDVSISSISSLILDYVLDLHTCAYATLVMKGDRYVAGAAVLGNKLRQLRFNKQEQPSIICMITEDVSHQAQTLLAKCFDQVILVPYLTCLCRPLLTSRQRSLYSSWISESFTKWNIFDQKLFPFEKILFLDSDVFPRKNLDHLFYEIDPPAACFSNCFSEIFVAVGDGIREVYEKPKRLAHGEVVPMTKIAESCNFRRIQSETHRNPKKHTFAISAVTVMIQPDQETFHHMLKILEFANQKRIPYGFPGVYSGFDEQMLCELMHYWYVRYNQLPRHISPGYTWNAGKDFWVQEKDRYVIHFYGDKKPWFVARHKQYPDTKEWWTIADKIQSTIPFFNKFLYQ